MKEIDVVLSGSGVKMMAFVGCLQALEDYGYKVKRIAGTSGGALIAALYAFSFSPKKIKQIVMGWDYRKWVFRGITFFSWLRLGLLSSKPIQKELEKHIKDSKFRDSHIELRIPTSNLTEGKESIFGSWSTEITVAKAARMSTTVPFGYAYVKHLGATHVDGGLLNNYPIDIFKDNQRPTLGFLSKKFGRKVRRKVKWPWQYFMAIFEAIIDSFERIHVSNADWANTVALDIDNITGGFNPGITKIQKEELYRSGYNQTVDYLKEYENNK